MAMNIRNSNDITTDAVALGPSQMGDVVSTPTSYNKPGLPKPPGGWNRNLGSTPISDRLANTYTRTVSDASI